MGALRWDGSALPRGSPFTGGVSGICNARRTPKGSCWLFWWSFFFFLKEMLSVLKGLQPNLAALLQPCRDPTPWGHHCPSTQVAPLQRDALPPTPPRLCTSCWERFPFCASKSRLK